MRKTKAKSDEMLATERAKAAALLVEFFATNGAKLERQYTDPHTKVVYYEYHFQTPLGILQCSFSTGDVHLHCRFSDIDRAKAVLNPEGRLGGTMNPHSGKYNTYAFGRYTGQEAVTQVYLPHLRLVWMRCNQKPWQVISGTVEEQEPVAAGMLPLNPPAVHEFGDF